MIELTRTLPTETFTTTIASPLGPLRLYARGGALVGLWLPPEPESGDHVAPPSATRRDDEPVLVAAAAQLAEYFAGARRAFELPLAPPGTAFQRLAWDALLAIPYGQTRSYGEQARAIGRPHASRAVGAANGANPIAIIIPCHRVIGASGQLTGYGGGLPTKRWLLAHEGALLVA